ncbi:MAG: hypothetical protein V1792_29160 [Pseudomonadota bacterium]
MRHTPTNRLLILRVYLGLLGTFTLFWWPLSHWFYPEWYHRLLGFESFDPSLVTIIGTTGLVAVLNIFFAALDPIRNRAMITILIVFSIAMAATYLLLIQTKGFPEREYANMTLLIVNTIVLITLYPRSASAAGGLSARWRKYGRTSSTVFPG